MLNLLLRNSSILNYLYNFFQSLLILRWLEEYIHSQAFKGSEYENRKFEHHIRRINVKLTTQKLLIVQVDLLTLFIFESL